MQNCKQGWWDDNRFVWSVLIVLAISILLFASFIIKYVCEKTYDGYQSVKTSYVEYEKKHKLEEEKQKAIVITPKLEPQKKVVIQEEKVVSQTFAGYKRDNLSETQSDWVLITLLIAVFCVWGGIGTSNPIIMYIASLFCIIMGLIMFFVW